MLSDRELGMHRAITRRDFLNGSAVAIGSIGLGVPTSATAASQGIEKFAQDLPGYYPPALTGMRGSHPGSYEAAHAMRYGSLPDSAINDTGQAEQFDLVVVGAGISGLAATYFYQTRAPRPQRVLILDNHDDFGGHAKRNEFRVNGRLLVTYGGTMSIESPFPYSERARALLETLQIDPVQLTEESSRAATHPYRKLKPAFFFDRETFGADWLAVGLPRAGASIAAWQEFLARTPLAQNTRESVLRLETAEIDAFPGLTSAEKKDQLSRISYRDYLRNRLRLDDTAIGLYQTRTHGLFGVGIDAVSALDCWGLGYPGFNSLRLEPGATARMGFTARGAATPQPPYNFHFPDGNASITRALVRLLVPAAAPAGDTEQLVTAKFDYSALDRKSSPVRIRLSSTVIEVRHSGGGKGSIETTYLRAGRTRKVTSKHAVLACWNMVIPYLCPELPARQREALRYGVKVPLVYTAVALRNWKAFDRLGVRSVTAPGMYHAAMSLEDPTSIGSYNATPASPNDPVIVRMRRTPCKPGLPERAQHVFGHVELLNTPFDTFERNIRDQLARALGAGGFDPARDIAGITVNRWPHGYAYEYNFLFDPEWPDGERPCQIARQRFGRIAIANSDAAAAAYTDQAIDQGYRAAEELLANS